MDAKTKELIRRLADNDSTLLEIKLICEYVVIVIVFRCWKQRCLYLLLFVKVWFWWRFVRGGCRVCFTEARLRSVCPIGEAGAAALARALEKNTVLQKLFISGEYVVFSFVSIWGSGGVCFYISCCL
jgi:hypothetical protein